MFSTSLRASPWFSASPERPFPASLALIACASLGHFDPVNSHVKCRCFRTKRRKLQTESKCFYGKVVSNGNIWRNQVYDSLRRKMDHEQIVFTIQSCPKTRGFQIHPSHFWKAMVNWGQFGNLPHRKKLSKTNLGLVLSCSQSRRMRLRSGPRLGKCHKPSPKSPSIVGINHSQSWVVKMTLFYLQKITG